MKKEFGYVTDREGNAVAGAEVYIKKQSDSSLVQLYSDDGSTTTSNPLTTDNDGEWSAYWANGVYKIQIFVDGVQQQEINQVQHFDFSELTDPGADRIAFWDDSATDMAWLSLGTGLAISGTTLSLDSDLSTIGALVDPDADRILFWDDSAGAYAYLTASTGLSISGTNLTVDAAAVKPTESFVIACSDESTALTTGTGKATFRMPFAFTLSAVRASVTTAPTGATLNVDINESGVSVLSTVITIDAGEKTSTTAATPAVISDTALADDAEITIDIDQIGSTVAGAGLKVTLIGSRA
jgi:hypothetical protein